MHLLTTTAYAGPRGGGISEAVRELNQALWQQDVHSEVHALKEAGDPAYLESWNPIPVYQYPSLLGPLGYARGFGWQKPNLRPPPSDFRPPTSDLRPPTSVLRPPSSVLRPPSSVLRPPDLLHNHGIWIALDGQVTRLARKLGVPYIVSPHGMLDAWALGNSRLKKKIASILFEEKHLEGATCFHALNESEAQAIRDFGLKQPIAIIPNGVHLPALSLSNGPALSLPNGPSLSVSTSDLSPPTSSGVEQRSRTSNPPSWRQNLPKNAKIMLFLGRIHPKKGLVQFLKSWSAVRRIGEQKSEVGRNKDVQPTSDPRPPSSDPRPPTSDLRPPTSDLWHLVIAGWDQSGHLAELERIVQEKGLNDQVHFIGPQFGADKEACFRHADAFVLPSFSEGMPMAILEAWSYGLPVLMTKACNIPEGFNRRAACELPLEPESQTLILKDFLAQRKTHLESMGENGRAFVREQFTWDSVAREMLAVYRWVISGKGPEPPSILDSKLSPV